LNALSDNPGDLGVVYKKSTGMYYVHVNGRVVPCEISNRLRKQLVYPTADPSSLRHAVRQVRTIEHVDPVAIGDQVRFVDAGDGKGLINAVMPRRSKLNRRSSIPMPGAHGFEQVIVANVDQVIPVFAAANPAPAWHLLDRYLVSAESLGLPALVCLNKLDLLEDDGLLEMVESYRRTGYPVLLVSAATGQGVDELRAALQGCVSVFVGHSGVGKTSLLNALQPGLGQRVGAVSKGNGRGRHTTTSLEMFPLDCGGAVVDTPGIREFGLWDVAQDDLALFFPEMRPLVGACKFGLDCSHDEEPGCAIRKAVTAGTISPYRYRSYIRLKEET
jgi:ribosome biogenesis GTPase